SRSRLSHPRPTGRSSPNASRNRHVGRWQRKMLGGPVTSGLVDRLAANAHPALPLDWWVHARVAEAMAAASRRSSLRVTASLPSMDPRSENRGLVIVCSTRSSASDGLEEEVIPG